MRIAPSSSKNAPMNLISETKNSIRRRCLSAVSFIIATLACIGLASAQSAATTVGLGAPTHVSATSGTNSVTIYWSRATARSGVSVIAYVVTSTPRSAGCRITVHRVATYHCTIGGLKPGTRYVFLIRAEGKGLLGPVSAVVAVTKGRTGPVVTTTKGSPTTTLLPPPTTLVPTSSTSTTLPGPVSSTSTTTTAPFTPGSSTTTLPI